MMRHIKALIFLCLPFSGAVCEESADTISLYCNASSSAISIDVEVKTPAFVNPEFKKSTINWAGLIKYGPMTNGRGQPLKSGSEVAVSQCGMVQVRIEGGFVNDNPQGQSGAFDFPVLELRIGERTVLQRTALEVCSENDSRANLYFGTCPSNWAQSIRTRTLPTGKVEVEIKRKYEDKEDRLKEVIERNIIF